MYIWANSSGMKEEKIEIKYFVADSIDELSTDDYFLVAKAREASNRAWAPYSLFRVGAALQLANGEIITGNNQENAAYPSGLCAERVALFAANALYDDQPVKTIAITAFNSRGLVREAVKPCGSCRQALMESEKRFEHPIRIILDGADEILIIEGVSKLLPLSFGKDSLSD